MSHLLSVITVAKDDNERLHATKSSLATQTLTDFSHYIINWTSRGSLGDYNLISRHDFGYIEKTFLVNDCGIYMAMNYGLALAKSPYLLFLNAGDTFFDNHSIARILPFLQTSSPSHFISPFFYSKFQNQITYAYDILGHSNIRTSFQRGALVCQQAIIYSRSHLITLGGYNESYKLAGDYELMCRIFSSNQDVFFMPIVFSTYSSGGISETRSDESALEISMARQHYKSLFL